MFPVHDGDKDVISIASTLRGDNNEPAGDPDIESVKFSVTLRPGKKLSGLDSLVIEKALLKFTADHVIGWAKYVRDYGMKKL